MAAPGVNGYCRDHLRAHRRRAAACFERRQDLLLRAAAADGQAACRDRVQPARERLRLPERLGAKRDHRVGAARVRRAAGAVGRGRHLRELLLQVDQRLEHLVERAGDQRSRSAL